jgi:hypothetical protein
MLRLKRYSYCTERTYLQWIAQFLDYAKQTGEKESSAELGADDCQNFQKPPGAEEEGVLIHYFTGIRKRPVKRTFKGCQKNA